MIHAFVVTQTLNDAKLYYFKFELLQRKISFNKVKYFH